LKCHPRDPAFTWVSPAEPGADFRNLRSQIPWDTRAKDYDLDICRHDIACAMYPSFTCYKRRCRNVFLPRSIRNQDTLIDRLEFENTSPSNHPIDTSLRFHSSIEHFPNMSSLLESNTFNPDKDIPDLTGKVEDYYPSES
jgi:hypothetical protein